MFGIDSKNIALGLLISALGGTCLTAPGCKAILNDKGECGFEISTKWVLIHETSETHSESTAELEVPALVDLLIPDETPDPANAESGEGEANVTLNENTVTTTNTTVVPTNSTGVPSVQPQ